MKRTASLALAGLAAALAAGPRVGYPMRNAEQDVPTPSQARRWRDRRNYPQSGTGKRQGERVARQVARALGDPFAASNKCLERIAARLAAR